MPDKYLEAGCIMGTHGIRGEVRVYPWADSPDFLSRIPRLFFDCGNTPLAIESARPHKSMLLLKIRGIDTVEAAQALRDRVLYLDREDITLPEGAHFVVDLIGCDIIDADSGRLYGTLTDVSRTGANDVYHIKGADGREVLFPAVDAMIAHTDLASRRVTVRPIKGIFDHED